MKIEKSKSGYLDKLDLFLKAFLALENGIVEYNTNPDSEVMKAGIIKMYEFTWELSWKTLKEYLEDENIDFLPSPRQTIKESFQLDLIDDDISWINILDDRNIMNHTYDQMRADEQVPKIINEYFEQFKKLKVKLLEIKAKYE